MALNMTAEEKKLGQENFQRVATALTRRDLLKSMVLTAGVVAPVGAAAYFQYTRDEKRVLDNPVKVGLIGAGDEGGVLIGEHNPKYVKVVAVADIRPSNQKRIFTGDLEPVKDKCGDPIPGKFKPKAGSPRVGLDHHYSDDEIAEIRKRTYDDYKKILDDKDIEAVIIALPLHLHAKVAIEALNAGKHVLCEKLMAWNITLCKQMIEAAQKNDRLLSIGHQRHYSLLYAHALDMINSGVLGDIRHIRALWHRNNGQQKVDKDGNLVFDKKGLPVYKDSWKPDIPAEDREKLEKVIKEKGYKSMEELVRWRLYNRTGAGLMAELGSHQLDACSIFLGKVHPIAVSGVGGHFFYRDNDESPEHKREVDDHVFVTFEFPGKNYYKGPDTHEVNDKEDKVIVTYSSISTNAFEAYGECVMGTKGSLVVEQEKAIMLYPEPGGKTALASVSSSKTALEASASTGGASAAGPITVAASVSRGYREEMEHFAYCIRMRDQAMSSDRPNVRCDGEHAMADAIIALTANQAMKGYERIEFKPEWFDPKSKEVPDKNMKMLDADGKEIV
jgi:predicted dehydrogenase